MGTPSPFETARFVGNKVAGAFREVKDENAIESILSTAMQSNDPAILQNSIGKILSQVSPERQGAAIEYLQQAHNNIQARQSEERRRKAALQAGINPDLPPAVQAAQFKEASKNKRINDVYGQPSQPMQAPVGNSEGSPSIQPRNSPFKAKTEDELVVLSGHPDKEVSEPASQQLKKIQEANKENRADIRAAKSETLPLRKEIIDSANRARESIRNKTHLIELIDKGNINDPSFAIFAESLPLNLGKRLLSDDTVEYKGGLVDEFSDLKNIFKGATRVKEVEIYENKLADLYLNDSQKKAILKSRINGAKVPIIYEEAASEVEEKFPNLTALQFNKKVQEIAQPKLDKLFNNIWDEQKAVFDQAEKRKEIPLDPQDPQDYTILKQILIEAGGDKQKARKLATKKGYKF